MHGFPKSALAALVIATTIASAPTSAATAEDAIKYRRVVMEEMASHMSALELILFDKVAGDAFAQGHADALVRASAELEVLFPAVSRDGDTEALPMIWDNPEKFSDAVTKSQAASGELQVAAGGDDRQAVLAAFAATGKACKACHESYRAEDDD